MAARQVAFLRGINVGRNKRIAMTDLRRLVSSLGYSEVSTHLQSGNVLLTAEQSPGEVARAIGGAIAGGLNLDVAVLARTQDELDRVVETNPLAHVVTDPTRFLIAFLSLPPERGWLTAHGLGAFDDSMLGIGARELYIWCPDGILASPIPTALAKVKGADLIVTSRNWRTVTKIQQLLRA